MGHRTTKYPEGAVTISVVVPVPVRDAIAEMAAERHVYISHLVGEILENWLKAQGRLPIRSAGEGAA